MKKHKPHPYSELLPRMTPSEFGALCDNVKLCGRIIEPIMLFQNMILDGRHREDASELTGIKPTYITFKGTAEEALQYIYSKAIHRNLTDSQKACAAVALAEQFAVAAEIRRKAGKKIDGVKGEARELAGAMFGVSGKYISEAKALKEKSIELFQKCFNGELPITRAKREWERSEKVKALKKKSHAAARRIANGDKRWEIITGLCTEELPRFSEGFARLIFADPPYNEGIDYGTGADADRTTDHIYLDWCSVWLRDCHRALAEDGSLFVMISGRYLADFEMILRDLGMHRRNVIAWVETFGTYNAGNFTNCWRAILYYTKSKDEFVWHGDEILIPSDRQTKYNDSRAAEAGKVPSNVWTEFPRLVENAKERMPHFPTQLPRELLDRIVKSCSEPGDMVLDPFNGSGTTGASALKLRRRYTGIEQVESNARFARQRLEAIQHEMEV